MLLALSLLFAGRAEAANKTWDGGCGAETAWSCAGNWSGNTVPAPGDAAIFNATSTNNSTVDAGFAGSVATVKIDPGYTGTVALARSLTVSNSFSETTGAFTAAGQALTLKALTLSGGSFTASSGVTSISGALTISGSPTFNPNGGTVDFTGTTSATLSCNGVGFNLVTFTNTGGTKTVGSNCSLPLGADPSATAGGSISLNGTLSGTGTLTTGKTLTLGTTGVLSGFSGLETSALAVNGTYNFGSYAPFVVAGDFALSSAADFTAPAGTASFAKNFTVGSGAAFNANGGTVNFNGATSVTLACGNETFNAVEFTGSGHKTIGSDCTLPLGSEPSLGKGGTTLNGTLSGTGTLSQTGTFEIGSSSPGLDSFANVADTGSLLLNAGAAFTAPAGNLTVSGNFTIAPGATFDANGGTVNFQEPAAAATKTLTCNGAIFNLVTIGNASKSKLVIGSDCNLPVGSEPTIGAGGQIVLDGTLGGSGVLTADSAMLTLGTTGSLSGFAGLEADTLAVNGTYNFGSYAPFVVAGDFALNEGAEFTAPTETASFGGDFTDEGEFDADGGTVELIGAGQQIKGDTTFFNLKKVVKAKDTLTFEAGATQTIEGDLTLEGAEAGKLLNLVSSGSPARWLIEVEGAANVKLVSVKDSENIGAAPIEAFESVDEGNNAGWEIFP